MPELNVTTLVLFSFPEAMVLAWLCLALVGSRPGFRQILQMGGALTLFDAFFFLVVAKMVTLPFGVHTVVEMLILSLIIQRVMRLSYSTSCLAAVLGFTVYISMENLLMAGITAIMGQNYFLVISTTNWMMRLPSHYLELLINMLLIVLIQRYNAWLIDAWPTENKMSFFKLNGLLFTQTVMTSHMYYQYYSALQKDMVGDFRFYFIMGNAALPIITIIIVKKLTALMSREIEVKAQLDTFRHVEELLHTMRIQRHDFGHEMQVIYGLLELKEFQEAREYLKKSMSEVAATAELVKTDNPGITALLYTKTGLAEARKIDLQITVDTSLQQLPQQARDINMILGNLIDNALDAVNDLPVSNRKVEVSIRQDLAGYILAVKNCGPPIPREVADQIFAPGFSSKGEGRGMGLYSVQKLVYKYSGDIKVTSDNNGTCFQVVIPAEAGKKRAIRGLTAQERGEYQWHG